MPRMPRPAHFSTGQALENPLGPIRLLISLGPTLLATYFFCTTGMKPDAQAGVDMAASKVLCGHYRVS